MKILKARNGIALVAVLAIMLITSLFIPLMFNLADTSLYIAVRGADRQKASYFARTVTEMSVAAFENFDSKDHVRCDSALIKDNTYSTGKCPTCGLEKAKALALDPLIQEFNALKTGGEGTVIKKDSQGRYISTDTVAMVSSPKAGITKKYYMQSLDSDGKPSADPVEITQQEHSKKETELANIAGNKPFALTIIEEPCEDILYFSLPRQQTEYEAALDGTYWTPEKLEGLSADEKKAKTGAKYTEIGTATCKIYYDNKITYYQTNVDPTSEYYQKVTPIELSDYNTGIANVISGVDKVNSYSKKENKNLKFVSEATVNNIKASRTCILVLPIYPTEEEWLVFGVKDNDNTGGNQVFVDPTRATSRVPINYEDKALAGYVYQNLLVYTAQGNMVIKPDNFKDVNGVVDNGRGPNNTTTDGKTNLGVNNSQLVLGVQPGLNTTPNNDPTFKIIDAVNYESTREINQYNNFVAFAAANGIGVEMPINLLVNPARASRVGDNIFKPNGSLFKLMIFQAPNIQFTGTVDMMMSFYARVGNTDARRMSSVILMAPESTPYSYYNSSRGKVVKAGMVYFAEDCYLWIVEPGDDGSSSSGWGFLSETIYKRDSDFTKKKIANAGDIYYFNSEITDSTGKKRIGLSLTGYVLETDYLNESNGGIWDTITKMFLNGQTADIYEPDDFHFVGNMKKLNNASIQPPEVDDYYSYWVN